MRKTILIIGFFFLTTVISCNPFGECPDIKPYFSIQGLRLSNLAFIGKGQNPWMAISEGDSIKWSNFFIRAGFDQSYHSYKTRNSGAELYALSCESSGFAGSKVGIDTMYVVTLQDYSSTHRNNDTINDIVVANYWTYNQEAYHNFFPLSTYISENDSTIKESTFEFKFTKEPNLNKGEYQFKLIYVLDDGHTFEATSERVQLVK